MAHALIVGIGGFVGAIARFKLGGLILHHTANAKFPVSTFVINVLGCFAIGLLGGLAERHHMFSPDLRRLLIVGVLGGFTTFSAFGFETVYLVRRGALLTAGLNVCASVGFGLLAVWLGLALSGELRA